MKILLHENLPKQLKADFGPDYDVKTVRDMEWLGKKNGELLGLIVFNGFDYFVTIDKNLRYQQNLDRFELKIFLQPSKARTVRSGQECDVLTRILCRLIACWSKCMMTG